MIGVEIYAQGPAAPDQVWALVGDLSRLSEWTDAEYVQLPDSATVITVDDDRHLRWTIVTREERLLEMETMTEGGRLGIGVRIARDAGGARIILAGAFWPRSASQAWRFRLAGAPALRRRFDRWCHAALRIAAQSGLPD